MMRRNDEEAYMNGWNDAVEAIVNKSMGALQWIPCSEKLPENGHYYLKCSKYGNVASDYYWDGFENAKKYGEEVVAWMPLPKPYKADMRGEEE